MSLNDILEHGESKSPLDCQSVVSQQINAITLLGFVCKELFYRHKEPLKLSINQMYKVACGHTTKPTTLLFGDDIAKTMQEAKAMRRITQNISARPSRRNQYQHFGNLASQNNSFLLQRGRGFPSRRGQVNPQPFPPRGKVLKELENIIHKVSTLDIFIINFLSPYLLFLVKSFSAGQISHTNLTSWSKITSDSSILQFVSDDLIEFVQPLKLKVSIQLIQSLINTLNLLSKKSLICYRKMCFNYVRMKMESSFPQFSVYLRRMVRSVLF